MVMQRFCNPHNLVRFRVGAPNTMKIKDILKLKKDGVKCITISSSEAIAIRKEFQYIIDKEYENDLKYRLLPNLLPEKRIIEPIFTGCSIYGIDIIVEDHICT